MLESLDLFNFQTHKKLHLDLSHPIVSIIGESDVGKSSVWRAIRWLCLGQPKGDSFVHHSETDAGVRLTLDSGRRITRLRKGSKGAYRLDKHKYAAFGTTVPEPISQLLNVSELSFQAQHDPVYALSLSPGQASRALNEIINLDVIDRILAAAAKEVRSSRALIEVLEQRVQQAQEEVKGLDWVEGCNVRLEKIEHLEAKIAEKVQRRQVLQVLLEQAEQIQQVRKSAAKAADAGQAIVDVAKQLQDTQAKQQALSTLIQMGKRWEQERWQTRTELQRAEKQLQAALQGRCPLCQRGP